MSLSKLFYGHILSATSDKLMIYGNFGERELRKSVAIELYIKEAGWIRGTIEKSNDENWLFISSDNSFKIILKSRMSIHYYATLEEIQAQELEHQLSDIAIKWRSAHSNAEILVKKYHQVMKRLWGLGYHGEGMSVDMELPDNLMPDYYLKYWREKEKEKAKKEGT